MDILPHQKHPKQRLQDGWVELLSDIHWDWFITHTFREPVHPERADKLWRLWCSRINRTLYGPRWHQKGKSVYWCRAIEYQRRDVIHFHGLMTDCEALNHFEWMEHWLNLDGTGVSEGLTGISRIYGSKNFRSENLILKYISKYVFKEGDIDLSPNLPGYTSKLRKQSQAKHAMCYALAWVIATRLTAYLSCCLTG